MIWEQLKYKFLFAAGILSLLCQVGCSISPLQIPNESENIYSQLPPSDIELNIEGLGPCNDGADRKIKINSQYPVTVLVHGCFSSAGRFRSLADVLAFHGQQSVCFSYDDRDSLMTSSHKLARALEQLSKESASSQITVMGHSQGGLIARKALVSEREASIETSAQLDLVTVSAPLAGVDAARYCANPVIRFATLGLHDLACWLVSGDKWHEITYASDFIRQPGALDSSVGRYLQIVTDERDSCRKFNEQGQCLEDDYVFSLEEQRLSPIASGATAKTVEIHAGHVEIVGEAGVIPVKLIQTLQQEGYIRSTDSRRIEHFNLLLARLYHNQCLVECKGTETTL
ncbi:alpha/beta hydrolase [uncultured Photobacterium sp.]|uniref:esterase/lipase family protein n=1 Tax=uncultured Photobacterium sp. TaxID=173973 RepID=UPI002629600D|nr:alpha/beta hydrolase [uncultured Photobacterium sp.]